MKKTLFTTLAPFIVFFCSYAQDGNSRYVNSHIGAALIKSGNTLVGPTRPWNVISPGPDCEHLKAITSECADGLMIRIQMPEQHIDGKSLRPILEGREKSLRCELYNLINDISEINPLNDRYPTKLAFLKEKLGQWMSDISIKMPTINPLFLQEEFEKEMYRNKTKRIRKLEADHHKMLSSDWNPNHDRWGSMLSIID